MPTKAILNIKKQIDATKNDTGRNLMKLEMKAQAAFDALMGTDKNDAIVRKFVAQVENSKDLIQDGGDWFSQWARVDLSSLIDTGDDFQRQLLACYLDANFCVQADFENDCLTYSIGPAIVVNDEGDVLDQDSGKWFISKNDYSSVSELNSLIEAYMQKTGCSPPVVRCDHYGNVFYKNTTVKIDE